MTETFQVTRTIPVPTSVSPEAQQFLACGLSLWNESPPAPAPDDLDGRRALIAMADEGLAMMMEMRVAHLSPTVELMSVGDVPVYVLTPDGGSDDPDQPIYFDIHGGGFSGRHDRARRRSRPHGSLPVAAVRRPRVVPSNAPPGRHRDLFLSNAVRMHRELRAAGLDAELHVFEAMPHDGFFGSPEDDELAREVRHFIAAHLPAT